MCVIGDKKVRTKTKDEDGKIALWGREMFNFDSPSGNVMKVEVWDEDLINDDLVGEGTFDFQKYLEDIPHNYLETIELFYKGEKAG